MKVLLAVALGGAIGAVARYKTIGWVGHLAGHGFPWGTLAANLLGSFAMGLLIEAGALKLSLSQEMRALLAVGLLGAFTTFSSFALDFATLWHRGESLPALTYAVVSTTGAILALFAGMALVKAVWA